ncbi:MAG: isochorismatase family protein [Phycisphaerae bacterium]|jgi:nicotinamidase-related amidase
MKRLRVLLDVDSQVDFFEGGRRSGGESATVAHNIRRLFGWADLQCVPVISTILRVRPCEMVFMGGAPYCVEDTDGEHKLPGTLLSPFLNMGLRNTTDVPLRLFRQYRQVLFEKRVTDMFTHVAFERLVTSLRPATFIICGADLERGVLQAALGLRHRGSRVIVARDAVVTGGGPAGEMAWRRMEAKGVTFLSTQQIATAFGQEPAEHFHPQPIAVPAGPAVKMIG